MQFDFNKLQAAAASSSERALPTALLAAEEVINRYRERQDYARDAIELLCRMTAERETAQAGLAALFPALIERLNDSFDPRAGALYDRIMAQVIDFYRRRPEGKRLDEGLLRFGLPAEADLLARQARLSPRTLTLSDRSQIKRAVLLSRVTIGADVAITSVLAARLKEALPAAELVLLGSRKLGDLYGGDQRLRIRPLDYDRSGGVLSRLNSWLDLVQAIDEEKNGLVPEELILIDPDSRLTQLGLLPLVREERNYFFFPSRSYRRPDAGRLGALASRWIDDILGETSPAFPYLALPREHLAFGKAIRDKMPRADSRLVTVSLGVGGNPNKRLSANFEAELIRQLSENALLILDKGASPEEREQIDRIVDSLSQQVVQVNQANLAGWLREETISAGLLTWEGGIGEFAGLIAASDQYVGYDSAGQHLAAALGVPVLTIFVNSNTPVFAERWHSYGTGEIKVIQLEAGESRNGSVSEDRVLREIMGYLRSSRQ